MKEDNIPIRSVESYAVEMDAGQERHLNAISSITCTAIPTDCLDCPNKILKVIHMFQK